MSIAIICPRCGYSGGGGTVKKHLLLPTNETFYWCGECSSIWTLIADLKRKKAASCFDFSYFEQRNLDVLDFEVLAKEVDWENELESFTPEELWKTPTR
jgi:hypothetical protein